MQIDDFYQEADSALQGNDTGYLEAFASVNKETESDDFDEDLDDFEEAPDSVEEDFEDDFDDLELEQSEETAVLNGSESEEVQCLTSPITSVFVTTEHKEKPDSIEQEILDYLEMHLFDTSSGLVSSWNKAFNDKAVSVVDCVIKYLQVHYCLWFESREAMQKALGLGLDFVRSLKFHHRMITKADINFISSCWDSEWFQPEIIDLYAVTDKYDAELIELMKSRNVKEDEISKYYGDFNVLMGYTSLVLADKFVAGEFDDAISKGKVPEYVYTKLHNDSDRFACIRPREDFDKLVNLIEGIELSGLFVDQEILEKYCEAKYLDVIIQAAAQKYLNESFADQYLVKDLGDFQFIADVYRNDDVDLSCGKANGQTIRFFDAKINTDLKKYQIDCARDLYALYPGAVINLIRCRYSGYLDAENYKKFLVALAKAQDNNLRYLDDCRSIIRDYNSFWMQLLLQKVLNVDVTISDGLGDMVVFLQAKENRKKKMYLELDSFVFLPDQFIEETNGVFRWEYLEDNAGIVLSNSNTWCPTSFEYPMHLKSSVANYAAKKLSFNIANQFYDRDPIMHTNLLRAIENANERLLRECKAVDGDTNDPQYQVSSTVLDFLDFEISKYQNYDKMLDFVAESGIFIYLLRSQKAKSLLMLFNNAYVYDNDAKRLYMLLYCIGRKYLPDRFELLSSDIKSIGDKTVVLLNGLNRNQACLAVRKLVSSLDNIMLLAQKSQHVTLGITDGTVELSL